jgi:hypothetical protein
MAIRAAEVAAARNLGLLAGYVQSETEASRVIQAGHFVITWAEKERPVTTNGVCYVRATMPAPTCAAFARYLEQWIDLRLAQLDQKPVAPLTVLACDGPGAVALDQLNQSELLKKKARLDQWRQRESLHEKDLEALARELKLLPIPDQNVGAGKPTPSTTPIPQ